MCVCASGSAAFASPRRRIAMAVPRACLLSGARHASPEHHDRQHRPPTPGARPRCRRIDGVGAQQQSHYSRPVTLVVPFRGRFLRQPGAAPDRRAGRRELGQPVVVENKPGAAGVLGANHVVRAAPGGYAVGCCRAVFCLPHLQKTAFDPMNDFSYVIHLSGYALRRRAQRPSWRDFDTTWCGRAKKRPARSGYGTTGINGA